MTLNFFQNGLQTFFHEVQLRFYALSLFKKTCLKYYIKMTTKNKQYIEKLAGIISLSLILPFQVQVVKDSRAYLVLIALYSQNCDKSCRKKMHSVTGSLGFKARAGKSEIFCHQSFVINHAFPYRYSKTLD